MCLFVGYNSQTKDYVYLCNSGKVYISCHALFNETVFSLLFQTILLQKRKQTFLIKKIACL